MKYAFRSVTKEYTGQEFQLKSIANGDIWVSR